MRIIFKKKTTYTRGFDQGAWNDVLCAFQLSKME